MKQTIFTHQEISDFCRGLCLQMQAGIGLSDGLFLLAEELSGEEKERLIRMGRRLDEGAALSLAMQQSAAFPVYAVGMVQVGERSGRMEEALSALAEYYRQRVRTRRQIKNALSYPALLILLMFVVIAVLLIHVLPVFDDVYASLGSQLTGVAGGLLYFGVLLKAATPVLWVLIALLACGVVLFSCWGRFRESLTGFWHSRWGDRGIWKKFNNARFARALAMGLSSGLSMEESMELGKVLLQDVPAAAVRVRQCEERLRSGEPLGEALSSAELLSPSDGRMLLLGQRSGNADRVMKELAGNLMEEAEQALEQTVAKVEPTLVLTASLLVGVILLSVMLPLMDIMSAIG